MNPDDDFSHIVYFAAKSNENLQTVCGIVQQKYKLPNFLFDCESETDEYGFSRNEIIGFNITKTDEYDEISTWMESAPNDVNFQIIVKFYKNGAKIYHIEEIQEFIRETVKSRVIKYHEW